MKSSPKSRAAKSWFNQAFIAVLTVTVVGIALAAWSSNQVDAHDLSVIGNGIPTVVQIHDPGCPTCRALLRNVRAASKGLGEDALQIRITDIKSADGALLASRYRVPHVTLLYFDGGGRMVGAQTGMQEVDALRRAFERHVANPREIR